MKPILKSPVLIALLAITMPLAAGAQVTSCHGEVYNCFILRVPSSHYDLVMTAHGLTFDEESRPGEPRLVMVTGPLTVLPDTTLANVLAEPGVLSFEAVDMAAVTEGTTGAGVDLAEPGFQTTLASTGTYTGPRRPTSRPRSGTATWPSRPSPTCSSIWRTPTSVRRPSASASWRSSTPASTPTIPCCRARCCPATTSSSIRRAMPPNGTPSIRWSTPPRSKTCRGSPTSPTPRSSTATAKLLSNSPTPPSSTPRTCPPASATAQ